MRLLFCIRIPRVFSLAVHASYISWHFGAGKYQTGGWYPKVSGGAF